MGGEFWEHHVPYQENIQAALETLREQEFRAGRFYQPDEIYPGFFGRLFGRKPSKPTPPKTIHEAMKRAEVGGNGTRSILDMERISDKREWAGSEVYGVPLGGVMWRVPPETLREWFGTDKPTREMIERSEEMTDNIGRGTGVCIITYRNDKPDSIYFAGYSYD